MTKPVTEANKKPARKTVKERVADATKDPATAPSKAPAKTPASAGPPAERFPARSTLLGEGLEIRRALPNRGRRLVGAWCFLDHAGPVRFIAGQSLRVGPHPHIGLQTFTWMIEGEVVHRDSLGYTQTIRPGQVNLMTAGHGIVHSEDSPDEAGGPLHLVQLWIALPDALRDCGPAFVHYPELPVQSQGGFRVAVLVGGIGGARSPVAVHSPLLALDLRAAGAARWPLPLDPAFEHAALTLRGEALVAGESLSPGTLLYFPPGRRRLELATDGAAHVLLIGGAPFGEEVLVWWNFVARKRAEIEAATRDWNTGRHFGTVQGSPSPRLVAPPLDGVRLLR